VAVAVGFEVLDRLREALDGHQAGRGVHAAEHRADLAEVYVLEDADGLAVLDDVLLLADAIAEAELVEGAALHGGVDLAGAVVALDEQAGLDLQPVDALRCLGDDADRHGFAVMRPQDRD
jgi:hypothetical protein